MTAVSGAVDVTLRGHPVSVAYFERAGTGEPVLYLHGLGSTKDDFTGAVAPNGLPGYRLVAFDYPGCGDSEASVEGPLTVDHVVETVERLVSALGLADVTIVGHSIGGLAGLLFARRHPSAVRRLVSVEGNLAPEDCGVFSREVLALSPTHDPAAIVAERARVLAASGKPGYDAFARRLSNAIAPRAFVDYCTSLVRYSDAEPLLAYFTTLRIPRLFIHGDANRHLSYLDRLRTAGIEVTAIPDSDHFPLDSNPSALYEALRGFLSR